MPDRILGIDSARALLAAKSCLAILVGYALALRFEFDASSVATTVIVLQTAALGSTLGKASLRLLGTFVGAVVGLSLVACCAHHRELFVLAMALLTAVCVWGMQTSTHQYAWLLVVVTSGVIGWPSAMAPENTFGTMVDRVTAVTLGVLLSSLVYAVVWPVTASGQFEATLRRIVQHGHRLTQLVRDGVQKEEANLKTAESLAHEMVTSSSLLGKLLQSARTDSRAFRNHAAGYQRVADDLLDFSFAAAALVDASRACGGLELASDRDLRVLDRAREEAAAATASTLTQLSLPRDGNADSASLEQTRVLDPASESEEGAESGVIGLLCNRLADYSVAATRVRKGLSIAEAHAITSTNSDVGTVPPFGTRLSKSALAFAQVLLGVAFFSTLNWPLGLQSAMVVVMAFAYLNAQLPVALLARTVLLSVAVALPPGAIFYFVVMPSVDSFAQLAPWLALFYVPFLYCLASRNPATSMAAMLSLIIAKSLISVSTTPPSYDFSQFITTYLGLAGGFSLVLLLAYIFETRSPRRGFQRLLAATLAQAADEIQSLTALPNEDATAPSRPSDAAILKNLGKLKKLAATINYRSEPRVRCGQISTVLRATQVLGVRLRAASPVTLQEVEGQGDLHQIRDWCAATLRETSQAVNAERNTVAATPPSELLHRLRVASPDPDHAAEETSRGSEFASLTVNAYYLSLVDAVIEFRRALESIDLQQWLCRRF